MLVKKKETVSPKKYPKALLILGNDLKRLVSNRIRPHLEVKIHRPASSASKTGACMCWTRLQRRLQTCYIKCSAVGIRCTFLWENIWPSWRKWTSIIREEFRSLSCAPLKDENSSCEQHHSGTLRCRGGICSLTNLLNATAPSLSVPSMMNVVTLSIFWDLDV